MMSAALRFSLGPTSFAVEPRSMMTSPSGTGRLLGCHVVIWVGSSSSTLRRRRRVALRWDPRGPPVPRLGGPPRFGPPGRALAGAPGRWPGNPPPAPPGREVGPPVREAGFGRGLIGRGPPGLDGRASGAHIGRRAPGGGGIGRPVALIGRPGGGGIGRPVELSGGRVDGDRPPPASPETERCVGRIVVGPLGDACASARASRSGRDCARPWAPRRPGRTGASVAGASDVAAAGSAALVTRLTRAGGFDDGGLRPRPRRPSSRPRPWWPLPPWWPWPPWRPLRAGPLDADRRRRPDVGSGRPGRPRSTQRGSRHQCRVFGRA